MALREILSTQAASAAVTVPAIDAQETSRCDTVVDKKNPVSSEGRVFDLDLNAGVEEEKVEVKEAKDEEGLMLQNPDSGGSWMGRQEMQTLDSKELKPVPNLNELDLNEEVKEEVHLEKPQIKKEEVADSKEITQKLVPVIPSLDDILAPIPKESNASKLVLAARDSWAANLEFIQDCTIRLLCVFALDRYVYAIQKQLPGHFLSFVIYNSNKLVIGSSLS
jgi:TATA-binding protein-associated factor